MKLTDGERLIAVMLSEVMEALELNHEVDPSLIKTLVCNGDDWAIKRRYSGIFSSDPAAADQVSETSEILWMWSIIEHSLATLTGAEADEAKDWHWTAFGGFDGNNDNHYGIARTLIKDLGEFEDFKDRNLNSHSQAYLSRYREMYKKFDGYVRAGNANPLSIDALRDLCS